MVATRFLAGTETGLPIAQVFTWHRVQVDARTLTLRKSRRAGAS